MPFIFLYKYLITYVFIHLQFEFTSRYRIQQGSFDDFTIDNQTGIVTISRKLDFDRRNTYQIEIVASDFGKFLSAFLILLSYFIFTYM